ncbi:MAG: MBL fold metallo-hydrolase [Clostridia bacterium]|nr:MBL fold metallo-hydrolase [Clostridia bacterium]
MIETLTVSVGALQANCHIVRDSARRDCVVIDAGGDSDKILSAMDNLGVKCAAVLLTHGHFDHMGAARALKDIGAKVYVHAEDGYMLSRISPAGFNIGGFNAVEPDALLSGGEELDIAGLKIKVYHTAGHSRGSVTYAIDNNLYCGDLLFKESFGRYDFEGGSFEQLKTSIDMILSLVGNYTIYTGHGPCTCSDYERKHNPMQYYGRI